MSDEDWFSAPEGSREEGAPLNVEKRLEVRFDATCI